MNHRARSPFCRRFPWSVLCGILASQTLAPTLARADFYFHSWELQFEPSAKVWSLSPRFLNYASGTNFSGTGASSVPTGLRAYSRLNAELSVRYSFHPQWTIFGRTTWGKADVQSSSITLNPQLGFGDQTIGLSALFFQSAPWSAFGAAGTQGFRLWIQAQVDLAPYNNSVAQTQGLVYLGDATTDISAGLFGSAPLSQ
jgi:hypothetical protein